jgi:hypothetical protein
MYDWVYDFLHYYKRSLLRSWDQVGPSEYLCILIAVGVIGWLLMRNGLSQRY